MTLKQARAELSAIGVSLRKSEGEYRVYFRGAPSDGEGTYYTDDLADALATGKRMHRDRVVARARASFTIGV